MDRFGSAARAYSIFRPHYPDALFDRITALTARRRVAWDCGTGNGQAAVALGDRFSLVVATDASAGQLQVAAAHPHVRYVRARAERAPIRTGSADLVTAAQALHWFDPEAFFAEVGRVLAPHGIVAVWTYGIPILGDAADMALEHFYSGVVGPYWAPARRHVETGYRTLGFPFEEIPFPGMEIATEMSREAFLGYVGTWSATLAYTADRGVNPIRDLDTALREHWPGDQERRIRWPLTVRIGRMR